MVDSDGLLLMSVDPAPGTLTGRPMAAIGRRRPGRARC